VELTRADRRELKKKQADEAKRGEGANKDDDGDGGDDLIANPNHITKKLNISDLSAPRELTRRERYVPGDPCPIHQRSSFSLHFLFFNAGSKRRRRRPRNVIGR
jgi:hypothetical protein